jgi:hypothetical protein
VLVGGWWVVGLIAGAESLGTLVWAPEVTADPVSDIDRRLLERAAVVASLLQFFQRNVAAAEAQVRGELLDELLSPSLATGLPPRGHPRTVKTSDIGILNGELDGPPIPAVTAGQLIGPQDSDGSPGPSNRSGTGRAFDTPHEAACAGITEACRTGGEPQLSACLYAPLRQRQGPA